MSKAPNPPNPQVSLEPPKPSYPTIEKLVATEDLRQINLNLGSAYAALEKAGKEGGLGKARDARKAMKAIEKVKDLLKELILLKRKAMKQQPSQPGQAASSPPGGVSGPQTRK